VNTCSFKTIASLVQTYFLLDFDALAGVASIGTAAPPGGYARPTLAWSLIEAEGVKDALAIGGEAMASESKIVVVWAEGSFRLSKTSAT
jgi:hypothetical protein